MYDTSQSQYVNLEYINKLVHDHTDFEVVDSKTGVDITKNILLQIISEQESSEDQSLLTNTLLKQLIRFYGGDMQVFVRQYLEHSLAQFLKQQDTIQSMIKALKQSNPINVIGKLVEKNITGWRRFQSSKDEEK